MSAAHNLPPSYEYPFKTEPYQHQLDCWRASKEREAYALFMEMGCGKSKVLIDTAAYLYDKGKIDGLLVVAPKGVYRNWDLKEIPEHMPDHVLLCSAAWVAAPRKDEKKAMERLFKRSDDLHVLVMNVEALSTKRGVEFAKQFLLGHKTLMAVDESTVIKNPTATRTKAIVKLGRYAEFRRIMSGEPAANSPLNLYSQFEFLGDEMLGYGSFYSFKNHFAVQQEMHAGNRTFKTVVGYQNLEELQRLIKPHAFIVKKDDCLDLPPKIYQPPYYVEMGEKQARAYQEMRDNAVLIIEEVMSGKQAPLAQPELNFDDIQGGLAGFCSCPIENHNDLPSDSTCMICQKTRVSQGRVSSAQIVITQLLRLHQIVCGFMVDDQTKEAVDFDENPRLDAMIEVLESIQGKAIIWANYRRSIQQIQGRLAEKFGPDSVVVYYGETDEDSRTFAKKSFQDPKSPTRFFVSNETGSRGLTLTEAGTVLYYSNSYDREVRGQSEDRAHRIGQKKSVVYIDLCCRGTVDEKIVKALSKKEDISKLCTPSNWRELFE